MTWRLKLPSQRLYLHDVVTLKQIEALSLSETTPNTTDVSDKGTSLYMTSILQKAVLANSRAKNTLDMIKNSQKRIHSWLNVNRLQLPLHNLDLDSNTIIRNSAEKSTGKFSDREESISTEELHDLMGENEKQKNRIKYFNEIAQAR